MIRKLGVGFIVAAALLAVGSGQAGAQGAVTVWVDDDDPSCGGNTPCHSSIQAATFSVSSTTGSGTVLVRPGHYEGGVAFYGAITLKSTDGPAYTTIDGAGQATAVKVYSPGGSVQGFTITGGGGFPNDVSNGWGVFVGIGETAVGAVRNNIITANHKGGVGVSPSGVDVDVAIEGNVITHNGLDPQLSQSSQGIRVTLPSVTSPKGRVHIANNVVAFNGNVNTGGGGILVVTCCPFPNDPPSDVAARILNNTVYANTAQYGGGLAANASDLEIHNNIFFANSAMPGSDLYLSQGALTAEVGSNVIGDGQFNGINGNISLDPLLANPANGAFELTTGSPAIDAGDNVQCPEGDQAGRTRPLDGDGDSLATCDMGAYEYCPSTPDTDGDLAGDACDGPGSGNVDCSGPEVGVNSVDALKVLRHSAGLSVQQNEPCLDIGLPRLVAPPDDWLMGDVNCSGGVNSVDALLILRANAGLSVALPVGCPEVKPP